MARQQTLGKKPQRNWYKFRNNTATTIKKGSPVIIDCNSTGILGFDGKSIESLAAAEECLCLGLAVQDTPNLAQGDAVNGYWDQARVVLQSRSASSAVWASTTGIALGDIYDYLTATGVQALLRVAAGSALSVGQHAIIACDTMASATTSASSITANADASLLYSTGYRKVYVTML